MGIVYYTIIIRKIMYVVLLNRAPRLISIRQIIPPLIPAKWDHVNSSFIAQHSTAQHSTAQHSTAQHSIV
jgi:hypothetical protein